MNDMEITLWWNNEKVKVEDADTSDLYYYFMDHTRWNDPEAEPIAQELSLRFNLPFNEYPGYMTLLCAVEREMMKDFIISDEIIFNDVRYTVTYLYNGYPDKMFLVRWLSETYWTVYTIGDREECIKCLMYIKI